MNKQDFKTLTGEDPEDMFGGDWENTLEEFKAQELCPHCQAIKMDEEFVCADCGQLELTPAGKLTTYYKEQAEI